jgi:Domain of unknown function (DUF4148)
MKLVTIVALLYAMGANSAFAQSTSTPATVPTGSGNVATTTGQQQTAGQWVPSDETSNKTRAEVYRELIQAQQDGQLAHLNKTVYAHH